MLFTCTVRQNSYINLLQRVCRVYEACDVHEGHKSKPTNKNEQNKLKQVLYYIFIFFINA